MVNQLVENFTSKDLRSYLVENSFKKVFLVTGKKSYESSGAKKMIDEGLIGLDYIQFSNFDVNPKFEDVKVGMQLFDRFKAEVVVAIGGGSVIDMAKLINVFSANEHTRAINIVEDSTQIIKKGKKVIAIPTTAGTGSEATHFAVVYVDKKKYSVAHQFLEPDYVGLQPLLTFSQPKYLTACAGLDALSQAIESYWSVNSNLASKCYAKEAIELLIGNLKECVLKPTQENRAAVLKGAYLAGKAINISKTTAPHALSYSFTTNFGIPHGHAVFLTLPAFFNFNYKVDDESVHDTRGVEYVRSTMKELSILFGISDLNLVTEFLVEFAVSLGVILNIKNLGIKKEDLQRIAGNVNEERLKNNPRRISNNELVAILDKLWK
jgi:alcohol dehydrogenase class IV